MLYDILYLKYERCCLKPFLGLFPHYISPNQLTCLACLSGVAVIPVLLYGLPGWATLLIIFSGYCDTLDGALARMQQHSSSLGTVLDITSDRIVEFAIIFALFCIDPLSRAYWVVLMLGSILICVTTFLVVGMVTPNDSVKGFYYSPGLIERAEAFIFFLLMVWLPGEFNWLAGIFSGLVLLTAILRVKQFVAAISVEQTIKPN